MSVFEQWALRSDRALYENWRSGACASERESTSIIYIYAFSIYPKRLTIAFRLNIFISRCVPWESNPQPFAQLTQCSTTEPQEHTIISVIPPSLTLSPSPEPFGCGGHCFRSSFGSPSVPCDCHPETRYKVPYPMTETHILKDKTVNLNNRMYFECPVILK